ncbi:MAG: hypothetical protein IJW15_03120 [Clostridia bacterium]|nr:hypothetical protein [Clostridia bacterium]
MIRDILTTFSVSGSEKKVRQLLIESLKDKFDQVCTDCLGNVIAKKGVSQKLLVECGMDSPGIMVVDNSDGQVWFSAFGGLKPKDLIGKKIIFENGFCSEVKYDGEKSDDAKISDLYIDADSTKISIGDFGILNHEFTEDSESYFGYGLKSRAGLLAVYQAVQDVAGDFAVLFSAQKRIGGKGIKAFLGENSFARVITVDALCEKKDGGGAGIVAKDSTAVASVNLRKALEDTAKAKKIDAKTVVSDENFFGSSFLTSGSGADWTGIGVLVEKTEDGKEKLCKKDFENSVRLLKSAIEKLSL